MMTATYSPEDNKLRLSSPTRLDADTYARVKAAGFSWAPKQQIFIGPMWTPERADLLTELCGEIGDEDSTLVERAEERAERFEGYRENRADDAEAAHRAVSAIADGIPLGQPILIGHHSEKHARKDAQRIENGMKRAVKMWETANYWKSRAAGAIRHAKYKEIPAVRARRIKGLESDIRVYRAKFTPDPKTKPQAQSDGEYVYCTPANGGGRGGSWVKTSRLPALEAHYSRWIEHCENRLLYERAMLAESGGLAADKFDIQVGGRVSGGGDWYVVTKLNKKDGVLDSVSIAGRYCSTLPVEEIRDYRAPEPGDAEKVKSIKKAAPLCNFKTDDCIEMTTAEWKQKSGWGDAWAVRYFTADRKYVWSREKVAYRQRSRYSLGSMNNETKVFPVFLTDAPVKEPPPLAEAAPAPPVTFAPVEDAPERERPVYRAPEPTKFDALREQLKAGVQVVSAPQLFPTPADLAARMVELAEIQAGDSVLEPSAGTGNIMQAVNGSHPDFLGVAVEYNQSLANALRSKFAWKIHQGDFLTCNGDLGKFDAIVMNPPFVDAQDIKHIQHALSMLKPGGRLVAICANGPRQQDKLKPLIAEHGGTWEDLPRDTFKESGTGVNTALIYLTTAKEKAAPVVASSPLLFPAAELAEVARTASEDRAKVEALENKWRQKGPGRTLPDFSASPLFNRQESIF